MPATGSELPPGRRRWAPMDVHQQWRQLGGRELDVSVRRGVVQAVCGRAARCRERDELRFGQERRVETQRARRAQHVEFAVDETNHLALPLERSADEHHGATRPTQRGDRGVGRRDCGRQPVAERPAHDMDALGVAREAEHPVRLHDVERPARHEAQVARAELDSIQIPPVGAIGGNGQRSVGGPFGLLQRLVSVADQATRIVRPTVTEFGQPQLGRVPRHVGVHPLHPCEQSAIGRHARRGEEVGAAGEHLDPERTIGRDRDDLVDRFASIGPVTFADTHVPVPIRGDAPVRISQRAGRVGFGCQQHRFATDFDLAQPLVVELDVERDPAIDPPRTAAVLVHLRTHVGVRWRHLDRRAVAPSHQRRSAALLRTLFGPPHVVAVGHHLCDADGATDQ